MTTKSGKATLRFHLQAIIVNQSTDKAVFVEEPGIFHLSSTYKADFVDGPGIFRLSSTYKAVSVDKPVDYVQFRPIRALKNQMGAAKQHMISAKSFWRTALKDHQATIVAAPQSPESLGVPQKAPGFCGGKGSGSTELSAWQPHRWQPVNTTDGPSLR